MRRTLPMLLLTAAILMILIGFAGLDASVYAWSCTLNTDRAFEQDFYRRTKWFWETVRFPVASWGIVAAGTLIWLAIAGFHRRGWRFASTCLIALMGSATLGFVLQRAIGRVRPNHSREWTLGFKDLCDQLWHAPHLTFISPPVCFPSGEATGAFAMATILAIAFPRGGWFFYPFAALIAVARLVQGSHYLSDVIAGALLGVVATRWLLRKIERKLGRTY